MLEHPFNSPRTQSANPALVSKNEWKKATAPIAHTGVIGATVLTKSVDYTILPTDLSGWGLLLIGVTTTARIFTLPLLSTVEVGVIIRFIRHGVDNLTIGCAGLDEIYTPGAAPFVSAALTWDGAIISLINSGIYWEAFT